MQWKTPKNTEKYQWTAHVSEKMHYYGLSEQKVLGVIRRPTRIETGIVENTVAAMMPVGNMNKKNAKLSKWKNSFVSEENKDDKWNQEIWVMYQLKPKAENSKPKARMKSVILEKLQNKINSNNNKKLVIISAWRYPGVSPKNNPIPEAILRELEEMILI